MLASCYKSDLSSTTHPDKGKMVINKLLPDDATPPAGGYTIIFNGESYNTTTTTTALDVEVAPGEYTIYVYSNHSEMSIDHDIDTSGEGTIISSKVVDAGMVESLTEDLYFGTQTITVLADQVISSEINLNQVTRDISFNLQITEGDPERIVGVTATLSGIAGQWECVEDIPFGDAVTIALEFTQGESLSKADVANDYLTGSIKVLGINGTEQILTIELTYSDGKSQKIVSDISAQLADANSNKSIAITLSGDINTPIESEQEGTITNWDQIIGGSETVN